MADTKYTNLTALEAMAALIPEDNSDLREKAAKMIQSEVNKREHQKNAKTNNPQKRKTFSKMVETMRAIFDAGNEPRGSQWIGEKVNDMMTPQKVSGVLKRGIDRGWLEQSSVKGKKLYALTEEGIALISDPAAIEREIAALNPAEDAAE